MCNRRTCIGCGKCDKTMGAKRAFINQTKIFRGAKNNLGNSFIKHRKGY